MKRQVLVAQQQITPHQEVKHQQTTEVERDGEEGRKFLTKLSSLDINLRKNHG